MKKVQLSEVEALALRALALDVANAQQQFNGAARLLGMIHGITSEKFTTAPDFTALIVEE